MDSIQKHTKVRRTDLSGEFYFQSLLREARRQAQLSESDVGSIMEQLINLLAVTTERYTKGRSGSVRVETAQTIMSSNLYTVSVYLKSLPDVSTALEYIKENPVSELHAKGREILHRSLAVAKRLYLLVRDTRIQNPNYTYNATIDEGIGVFFRQYDPDFEAHETPASIDYQLLNPVIGLAGIEFMMRYLESLYLENLFCFRFSAMAIHEVMLGYDRAYEDLLVNICEQVLQNALGCEALGKNVLSLILTPADVQRLKDKLESKTKEYICDLLQRKAFAVIEALNIRTSAMDRYICASLPEMVSRVHFGVNNDTLHTIFVPRHPGTVHSSSDGTRGVVGEGTAERMKKPNLLSRRET